MTPNEYQVACLKTWAASYTEDMQAANCALGIAGESGELISAFERTPLIPDKRIEELGDLCYYLAVGAFLNGRSFQTITEPPSTPAPLPFRLFHHMAIAAAGFTESTKQYLFAGHPLDHSRQVKHLAELYRCALMLAQALDVPIELIFEANIAKLTKRYAGGAFDPARSQRRVDQALGTPA